ncbi:MAG: hypothetical protein DIJKHBIC_01960 [Thermoanaerobaculia bacterium]|nr:hypothetical protein [Thermoanaerobaculia bacterium]
MLTPGVEGDCSITGREVLPDAHPAPLGVPTAGLGPPPPGFVWRLESQNRIVFYVSACEMHVRLGFDLRS